MKVGYLVRVASFMLMPLAGALFSQPVQREDQSKDLSLLIGGEGGFQTLVGVHDEKDPLLGSANFVFTDSVMTLSASFNFITNIDTLSSSKREVFGSSLLLDDAKKSAFSLLEASFQYLPSAETLFGDFLNGSGLNAKIQYQQSIWSYEQDTGVVARHVQQVNIEAVADLPVAGLRGVSNDAVLLFGVGAHAITVWGPESEFFQLALKDSHRFYWGAIFNLYLHMNSISLGFELPVLFNGDAVPGIDKGGSFTINVRGNLISIPTGNL